MKRDMKRDRCVREGDVYGRGEQSYKSFFEGDATRGKGCEMMK